MTTTRIHAWCIAAISIVACGGEDNTDSSTIANTDASDTSDTMVSATASSTASSSVSTTTSPPETTNAEDGPLDTGPAESGPVDTGEDTSPPETGEDTTPPETGDTSPPETGEDTSPPETGESGGDALAMCLEMAEDACEECACDNCLGQLMACQADPGCVAIRMCAQENNCTGVGCLEPCGAVIDANGGLFGESVGLASTLSDCYEGACADC